MTRSSGAPRAVEGHPDRWKILAVLCAALCIVVLDNTILSVAVPSIGGDLGATESQLQWIVAAYGLVLAGLLLPLAGIGDRTGRRRLLLVGVAGFGLASAGAAAASSAGQLTFARGVLGIGGAATMPATLAILGNVFSEHERARAIAIWSGVSGLAAAAGPVVGGVLLEHFWWGSVFLVNVPITIAVFAAAWLLVPDSRDPATPRMDVVGSALWTLALVLVLFAVIEGGELGWTSPRVGASALGGLALLGVFARWERRTEHPLLAPSSVADRRMQAGMVVVPVLFFSAFGLQFVLTQWLQGVQGLSPLAAGACFVPHATAVIIASLASTHLVGRVGLARTVAVGIGFMVAALLLASVGHGSLPPVVVAVAILGFGIGLACPPGVELVMGSVHPDQAGQAAGINETIVEAGGALGVAVLGSVLGAAAGVGRISPEELAGPGAEAAKQRFTDALQAPLSVTIVVLLVGAVVVLRRTRGTAAAVPPVGPDALGAPADPADPGPVSGAADRPPVGAPTTGS
ncbi:MAG: MFS transporter [Actinobacteria bacterium]|nr:MFS transporter [Actinomycetota bacterium]